MIYELEHGLGVGGGRGRPKGSRNGFISPGAAYMKNYQIRGEKALELPDTPATQQSRPADSVQRGRAVMDRQVKQSAERDSFGRYGRGTIDLLNRKVYIQPDGSYSTENSLSFYDDDIGKEVLIPTIVNGQQVSDDDAIDYYYWTKQKDGVGEHLGTFDTPEEADDYAERLHQRQGALYGQRPEQNQLKPQQKQDEQQKGYGLGDLALDYLGSKLPVRQAMRVNDRANQFMQENNIDAGEMAGRAADRLDPAKAIGNIVRGIFGNEPEPEPEDKSGEVIGSIVEELFSADAGIASEKGAKLHEQVDRQSGSSRKRNFGEGTASIGNIGDVVEGRAANYNLDQLSKKGYGFGDFMMDMLGTIVPVRSASNTASNVSDFFRTSDYNERYPIADLNQLPEYYDVSPLMLNAANNLIMRALGPEERPRRTYRSAANNAHFTR